MLAIGPMAFHTSGKRPDLADAFIDCMLEERNSAVLTSPIGSGNPNADALKCIRKDVRRVKAALNDAELRRRLGRGCATKTGARAG